MNTLKTAIKMLTPFIISVNDIISGVLLFLRVEYKYEIDPTYREWISHCTGSSILVILYIIVSSTHMCKYYKTSCYTTLLLHILALIYIYTEITIIQYIYIIWISSVFSLVCWTISFLGHKTYKTIHQACTREQTE